jgi:hypothetical protein
MSPGLLPEVLQTMRTLVDPRPATRYAASIVHRRRAEQRARRQIMRELDRLDEKRRATQNGNR